MYRDTTTTVLPWTKRTDTDTDTMALMCKALGHPARIAILNYLLAEDRCICGKIVAALPLAQSTVSQHLKILKESGLIQGEVEGPKTCYCINKQNLHKLLEIMTALFNQVKIQ